MAIQDYVPKLDVGYDANQAFANANESMRNIGQIKKATADTTAQGWKSLQDAFNSFIEQDMGKRKLDLTEKELADRNKYNTGVLEQGKSEADWKKANDQSKNAFDMYRLGKEMDNAAADRRSRELGKDKDKPEGMPTLSMLIDEAAKQSGSASVFELGVDGKPFVNRDKFKKQFNRADAISSFEASLIPLRDEKKQDQFRKAFIQWYDSGVLPTEPIIKTLPASSAKETVLPQINSPIITGQNSGPNWDKALNVYQSGKAILSPEELARQKEEEIRRVNLER
jgi:hypothetical protein